MVSVAGFACADARIPPNSRYTIRRDAACGLFRPTLHGPDAAIEAARARFRPILMTSFAFILGVAPLVFATGAGASARKSIGITVFSGMIASTCLAILFVPTFFVLLQRFEERLAARKGKRKLAV